MSTKTTYRIGQIVPSSNTTMETEIPAMLRARELVEAERFTFFDIKRNAIDSADDGTFERS